jgi:hypothetical protein
MQIDVASADRALAALDRIERKLGTVGEATEKLNSAKPESEDAGLGQIEKYAKSNFFDTVSGKLENMGQQLKGFSMSGFYQGKELFDDIVKDASTFQDTQSSLQFAFGKGWERVFSQVKDEAANLTFTFDQVAGLAASMGRMKINPFGTTGDDLKVFKT